MQRGQRAERLNQGQLVRGPNQITEVRATRECAATPAEKTAAFYWHPGDLRVPLDQLKGRYDADVWALFESKMKSIVLDAEKNITVWDWLNGAKLKTPEQELHSIIEAVENVIATMRREQLTVFGPEGEERFSAEAPVETPQRIALEPIQYMRFEDATVSHNHPDGSAFSFEDVELLLMSNAREFRVVTPTKCFIVRRATDGWPRELEERLVKAKLIRAAFEKLYRQRDIELHAKAQSGHGNIATASADMLVEAFEKTAQQQGWVFIMEMRK